MSPPRTEFTSDQRRALLKFVGINCLLTILLFVVVGLSAYQTGKADAESKRAGCERNKLDRAANAAAWTAHRTYIEKVLKAASVKQDVKDAADDAVKTYKIVSADLSKRSKVDCDRIFPDPSLLKFGTAP